jgi:DNA-binding GntR family transcriptional regulator
MASSRTESGVKKTGKISERADNLMEGNIQLERPPLLVDLIIEKLQDAIIRGVVLPGTRLTEQKLSQGLETSRTPLREALFKIELMGFVRHRKNGGWDVPPIDVDKILERLEEKVMIETYAILRSDAKKRSAFARTARDIVSRMQTFVANEDYEAYRNADREFHRSFVDLFLDRYLQGCYTETIKHIDWIRKVTISPLIDVRISLEDHGRIVEALEADDVHRTIDKLIEHSNRQVELVRKKFTAVKKPLQA